MRSRQDCDARAMLHPSPFLVVLDGINSIFHTVIYTKSQLLQVANQHCLKQLLDKSSFPTQTLWEKLSLEVTVLVPVATSQAADAESKQSLMTGQPQHLPFLRAGSASLWDTTSSSPILMLSFFSLTNSKVQS